MENVKKKRRPDKEIVLEICELYLQLVENEMETKPLLDSAIFKDDTEESLREMFKEHIANDIKKEIKTSNAYLNLKVVLMAQDNRDKIERSIKTFLVMLGKKGILIGAEDETKKDLMLGIERWIVKRMKA